MMHEVSRIRFDDLLSKRRAVSFCKGQAEHQWCVSAAQVPVGYLRPGEGFDPPESDLALGHAHRDWA
jgi:hypothetical protein